VLVAKGVKVSRIMVANLRRLATVRSNCGADATAELVGDEKLVYLLAPRSGSAGNPVYGTMALSFIEAFDDETAAFESCALARPKISFF
jgi:hypothetical protein